MCFHSSQSMIILNDTSGLCDSLCAQPFWSMVLCVFICHAHTSSRQNATELNLNLEVLGIIPTRKSHLHQLFKLDFPHRLVLLFLQQHFNQAYMDRNRWCSELKGITFLHVCSDTKTSKSYGCQLFTQMDFCFLLTKGPSSINWHTYA